jgi:hypothetical protein
MRSNILDSLRFWRFISLVLALAFLVLFYQSSQTGRYRFNHDPSCIIDTRTGIMYSPLNDQGIQELTPLFPLK